MMMQSITLIILILLFPPMIYGEEFDNLTKDDLNFEMPAKNKNTIEIHGNLEGELLSLNKNENSMLSDSAFFSSNYFDFYLDADYQNKYWGVHLKSHTDFKDFDPCFDFYEAYNNINFSTNRSLEFGKRIYNWGKGYAFNVVGFVNPIKSLGSTGNTLRQEGLYSMNFEAIKSFNKGVLKNLATNVIVVFPQDNLLTETSDFDNYSLASKIYFLLGNIDIDLMKCHEFDSEKNQIGMDISSNILTNIELYGEAAYLWNENLRVVNEKNVIDKNEDGLKFLIGAKILNSWNTTFIMEYLHNNLGLNNEDYLNFINSIKTLYDTGLPANIASAQSLSQYINKPFPMRNYLDLKISQPEPFGWVYFTPSVDCLYNIDDSSKSISIDLSYKIKSNSLINLTATTFVGGEDTEFGIKPYQEVIKMRYNYSF